MSQMGEKPCDRMYLPDTLHTMRIIEGKPCCVSCNYPVAGHVRYKICGNCFDPVPVSGWVHHHKEKCPERHARQKAMA